MTRKPSRLPWIIAAAVAALLAGYIAAYYAMAFPVRYAFTEPFEFFVEPQYQKFHRETWVASHEEWRRTIFFPIHWIDRQIRRRIWMPTEAEWWHDKQIDNKKRDEEERIRNESADSQL